MADNDPLLESQRWMIEQRTRKLMGGVPRTPIGGSAMMSGPDPSQEQAMIHQQEAATISPADVAEGRTPEMTEQRRSMLRMGAEVAFGSMVAAASGGLSNLLMAPRALMGRELLARSAELGARAVGGALGQAAGSEMFRPPQESDAEKTRRRSIALVSGFAAELGAPLIQKGISAVGHAAGAALGRTAGKSARRGLEVGAAEVQKMMLEEGATLTAGQVTRGWTVDTLENIAEASLFGGSIIAKTRDQSVAAAMTRLERTIPNMVQNLGTDDVGALLSEAIENSALVQRAMTRAAYGRVDAAVAQAGGISNVPIRNMIRGAKAELSDAADAGDKIAAGLLRMMVPYEKQGGVVSFAQADKLRSRLYAIARADDDLVPGLKRYAAKLGHEVDTAMEAAAQTVPNAPDVLFAINEAREMAKFGKETFNNELMANLMGKASKEQIVRALFQADSPGAVRAVFKVLNNPRYAGAIPNRDELIRTIQGAYITSLRRAAGGVSPHLSEKTGGVLPDQIDYARLRKELTRQDGTFVELFQNDAERKTVATAIRGLEMGAKRATDRGTGSIFVQLTQSRAVVMSVQALSAGAVIGASKYQGKDFDWGTQGVQIGMILLAPAAFAAALSRKNFASYLVRKGMTGEARSGRAAASLMAETIAALRETGVPFIYQDASGKQTPMNQGGPSAPPIPEPTKPVSKLQLQ